MTAPHNPASPLWIRFAHEYRGDGAAAMAVAGSTASAASRASMASRALRHPDVMAILAERRGATPLPPPAVLPPPVPAPAPRPPPVAPPPVPQPPPPVEPRRVNVAAAVARAEADGCDPIAVLGEIANDDTIHASSRVAAANALARHNRQTSAERGDQMAELRPLIRAALAAKLARERDDE